MIGRRRLFHIYELNVASKPKGAALFDQKSYATTVLYFKDEAVASGYAKQNFPNDDSKIQHRLAVGDNERYTIMDPKQELKLTNDNSNDSVIDGKRYRVYLSDDARYAGLKELTNFIYYMKESPMKTGVGFRLDHTPHLKDATHFLFTYQAGEGKPMIAVLAEPRKEEVTLTSSKRNTVDVSHHCKGRK